jgi:ABC-type dipeptide/oligopeptide/nickel transport systems, permease components
MLKFILRRLLEAIPTLFILITISFFMMRLAPGSPFTGERTLSPEVMANIEAKYHLNDPIGKQYVSYLVQLAHGDFGPSFKYKDYSVNYLVGHAFPVSAKLGLAAFFLAVVLGVTAGVIAALKQNSLWDYAVMGVAMTGVVIPSFVVAPLLVLVFAITLRWLPGGGWNGGQWNYMLLPMVALSLAYIASIARITRGSMIEVMSLQLYSHRARQRVAAAPYRTAPCIETSHVTRALVYGAGIRRHHHRFNGDRIDLRSAGYWPAVC